MKIEELKSSKILVIGDTCLDVYHYGRCDRISPEAPVPVFQTLKKETRSGMASNVVNNLLGLENEIDVIVNKQTIVKNRYVDDRTKQHLLRVDEGETKKVEELSKERINEIDLSKYDAIVISDYNKGFLSYDGIEHFLENVYNFDPDLPVFIDTKKKSLSTFDAHSNCIIKINQHEFEQLDESTCYACELIVTLGSSGAWLVSTNNHYEAEKTEVFDVCGAGDTFLSGLVTGYLSFDRDLDKAIKFANKCASYSVNKLGTYAIKKEDLSGIM